MRKLTLTSAIVAFTLIIVGCQSNENGAQTTNAPASTPSAISGVQKVTVTVDNGFAPANLEVKAGQPVELTFDTKHRACASTVVFKELNMTKSLTDGQKTVVNFTPDKPGTLHYACGMNMMKGEIVVQ